MGNALNCLEQCRSQQESNQRLLFLQKGAVFKRRKFVLGISSGSEQIHLRLSADEQALLWRTHETQKELARIELSGVHLIKTHGSLGWSLVSKKGDTLLDLEAASGEDRDTWVTSLQLLCEDCGGVDDAGAESASAFRKMLEEKAQKQAYWSKRTEELEERKREAEERKKQFAGTGLKYTAIALSNRS
ncbi:hypothetical protein PybrP1_011522 [[Pythium] brassicae (nom. inval.)]|nr:hypothetical protein PybrP1_011522 [[Pythium] brassicae (nom. inval.)]